MHVRRLDEGFSVAEARGLEDAQSELRMELIDGAIYSMGRATPWHAAMTAALSGCLREQLGPNCRAYAESLAVGIAANDATYVHPDVSVVCGRLQTHPDEPTVVLNPAAVFEVLSPGTALRDRNEKLAKYQAMASVQAIVYFEYDRREVTAWLRLEDGWHQIVRGPDRVLDLPALGLAIDVGQLYLEVQVDGGPDGV